MSFFLHSSSIGDADTNTFDMTAHVPDGDDGGDEEDDDDDDDEELEDDDITNTGSLPLLAFAEDKVVDSL